MTFSRKRGRQEMEAVESIALPDAQNESTVLVKVRNMWEFANLAQFIFLFGRVFKIDENIGIEELEMAFQDTTSTVLQTIGLQLLKFISSHRGLTPEIFDEYTRRQYVAKAPNSNPFGEDDVPRSFTEFSAMDKIRVLQQLTQWTMFNPDRFREKVLEVEGIDKDQTYWRVEPFGWDSQDRTYIVLDDNRLYRQTEPPPPPTLKVHSKPKKGSKKAKAAARASKKRKTTQSTAVEDDSIVQDTEAIAPLGQVEDNGLGGAKWECLAISLDQFKEFLSSIEKSRDINEKDLHQRITDDVLPLLEKQEESRKRKQALKERELLNIQKLATAKRSGRLAGKAEQKRQEEEAKEAERKAQADLIMAKKEQEKWMMLERERESRMQTREQRLREREARRILHEAELANLSEDSKNVDTDALAGRIAERHLKAEMQRKKAALKELQLEDDWVFDCICGIYGQVDDGTLSIACEKCNVWQHTKCVGVSEVDAKSDTFEFVCKTCLRRETEAKEVQRKLVKQQEENERHRIETEDAKNRYPSGIKIKLFNRSSSASLNPGIVEIPLAEATRNGPTQSPQHLQSLKLTQQSPLSSFTRFHQSDGGAPPPLATWEPHPSSAKSLLHKTRTSPSIKNAFQPPQAKSPTSLPPPQPSRSYASVNQSSSTGANEILQSPAEAYYRQQAGKHTPATLSRLASPNFQQGITENRRIITNLPSPLIDAPVLNPLSAVNGQIFKNETSASFGNPHANQFSRQSLSPSQTFATPTSHRHSSQHGSDLAHLAALPDSSTGISPTKTSPPRSKASEKATTPHALPSIPVLSPNPQHQNLTPPVKHNTSPHGSQTTHPLSSPVPARLSMANGEHRLESGSPVSATLLESVKLPAPHLQPEPISSPIKSESPILSMPFEAGTSAAMRPLKLNGSST